MVLSVFGGMAFPAGAESKTIAEGVIYKLGDTIVLPGDGVYYVKDSERHPAQRVYSNGTVTRFEGDEYSYTLEIDEWGIYAYLDMFDHQEELNQGLSVLGITFTGSGTQSDPYMPKPALGVVESTWAGEGEGTEASPWLIKDLNDLRTLSANVEDGMTYSGKYLKLAADIDCGSDNWEAIGGANAKMFMGTFDGDSHTITYRVSITGDESDKGLFYGVGAGGTVKNLNVAGSISSTSLYANYLGGIAANNAGTITNCASSVDITGYGNGIAGIAAYCQDGATISYCAASGTISWPQTGDFYAYVAGITGTNSSTTISNCASLCDIIAPNADSGKFAGRLVARDSGGAYSDNYYLSTAQIEGEINSDYATAKTADELKEIGQAAYDAGYTVYGLALGAVASNPDQDAADAVIALIDAIGTVALTDECKAKIDDARAAYDALTDAQKALVSNYETLTADEAEYAALQLLADKAAFEAYKAEQKAAVEAMAEEGDSTDAQQIIADAAAAIDALTYDEAKTLDENKAAADEIADIADALAEQRAADKLAAEKAAFEAYKAEKKTAVEAMAEEGDSEAAQKIIADAAAAIEALTYNEAETLDANKAAVDALADIADALAAQRAADKAAADQAAADEAAALIDAIGEVAYTDDSKAKIDAAKAAYEALTDEQKALVANYEILTSAETAYADLAPVVIGVPQNLQAFIGNGGVTLTWDETDGAQRYMVYVGKTENGPFKAYAATSGLSYTFSTGSPSSRYYKVRGFVTKADRRVYGGYSDMSTCAPFTTTGLSVEMRNGWAVLNWEEATDAEYYMVYYSTTPDGPYKAYAYTSHLTYKLSRTNVSSLWYKVRAFKVVDGVRVYGPYSEAAECIPGHVYGVQVAVTGRQATLTWNETPGAERYMVYTSTSADGPFKAYGATSTLTYTLTSSKAADLYYKVRAFVIKDGERVYGAYSATAQPE
jgi:hypothetical protein